MDHYSPREKRWLEKHEKLLPSQRNRKHNTLNVGTLNDLAEISDRNPRQGSSIYLTGTVFTMAVINIEQSPVFGAPEMPIWQWLRPGHRKRKYEYK